MPDQREERVLWGTGRSANNPEPANAAPPQPQPAETAQQQTVRRTIVYAGAFILGGFAVSAVILVLMFLFARPALESGGWILLILPVVTAAILAAFAPRMPVNTVRVPEGTVSILLDKSNNIKRVLPPGEYHIPPEQSYAPYPNQGIFSLKIGGDKAKEGGEWVEFRAGNSLSYPVQCQVVCRHDLREADPTRWPALLKMTKDIMAEMLRPDIEFIIRENLYMYKHDELDHNITMPQVLNQIRVAIERLVNSKEPFGIFHVNTLLAIDPPDQVRRAVAQRVALEKFAIENREAFEKLIGRTAGIELDKDGYLKFTLTPSDEVQRIPLLDKLFDALSKIVPQPPIAPTEFAGLPEPKTSPPKASAPTGEEVSAVPLRVEPDVPEEDTQPVKAEQPRPTTMPLEDDEDTQRLPKNPIFGHKSKPVIDMDEKDGIYVRRPPRE